MKYIRFVLTFLTSFLTMSCNSLLDISTDEYIVQSEEYYMTEEDLNAALRGVYSVLSNGFLYGDYMQGRLGLEADEGFPRYAFDDNSVSYYEASSSDAKILAYWRTLYRGINQANALLENIDRPVIDSLARQVIRGEALFLRGYFYFMLVNRFDGVPLLLKPTKEGSLAETQIARSSAKEVYAQIISDMAEAANLVKDIADVSGGGVVTKSAVWGVLARVCLYMAGNPINDTEKYTDAVYWASKVINLGHHALNPSYQQVFMNYAQDMYDTKESILEAEMYGNGTGLYTSTGGKVGLNNGIINTEDYDQGYCVGILHPTAWLHSIYNINDLRRNWNVPDFRYSGNPAQKVTETGAIYYRYCGKYRREYETLMPKSSGTTPQNAPILRYADVLLMYAEAVNEINQAPTTEAFEAINQVRRRAYGYDATTPNAAVDLGFENYSYEEFKEEIRNERARELCFEGLRKNDLIRWGVFYNNMKTILAMVPDGTTLVLKAAKEIYSNASYRDVLWPIPSYELDLNKKLVQNSGW